MPNRLTQTRCLTLRITLNCVLAVALFVCVLNLWMRKSFMWNLDHNLCIGGTFIMKEKHKCPTHGVITVVQGGRLANQIWEYASVWAVARESSLAPYVPSCILKNLNRMFVNLSVPSLSSIRHCVIEPHSLINDPTLHRDNVTKINRLINEYENSSKTIVLPIYVTLIDKVIERLDEIKRELTIRPKLLRRSKLLIIEVIEEYAQPVTLVGMHVRRTDYESYLKGYSYYLAGASFFYNAMAYFESRYDNVAFIVVSDDPDWCWENLLIGRDNVHIISDEFGSPELDLAVMASCNHSIIDYGTYGVWGALFAGGETVVYNITHKTTDVITQLMPNWQFMD